jgi:hypothetical protein
MPSPALELVRTHGQTPAAAAFITAHTLHDLTNLTSDECPVCLDNYHDETCLRITEIEGCTHRIGEVCLGEMLSNRPSEEKKCPLCRTVWVPASPERQRIASGGTNAAVPPDQHIPATAQYPVLNVLVNLDNQSENEDYVVQVESFNQLRRDIEDVRARARNTQVSRGQRRQEMRDETARQRASDRASRTEETAAYGDMGTGRAQPRLLNSLRGRSDSFTQSARHDSQTRGENRSRRPAMSDFTSPLALPVRSSSLINPVSSSTPRLTSRTSAPTTLQNHERPSINALLRSRIRSGPQSLRSPLSTTLQPPAISELRRHRSAASNLASPSPRDVPRQSRSGTVELPKIHSQSHGEDRVRQLNQRQTTLNARELKLNHREFELTRREITLDHRETELNERERSFTTHRTALEHEGKDAAVVVQAAKKHREEMETLVKKHGEEMDKLLMK